jgi:lysozyme family protein
VVAAVTAASGSKPEQTMDPFAKALAFSLQFEGGYCNHPADPGGATMRGVTQRTYDGYRRSRSRPVSDVRQISPEEVSDCYRRLYWEPSGCPALDPPLATAMLDTAINFGVHGAVTRLQSLAGGLTVDGDFGPKTLARVESLDQKALALKLCDVRIAWRWARVRSKPSQAVFLKGWLRRDHTLKRLVASL